MFTGIIESMGQVIQLKKKNQGFLLTLQTPYKDIPLGSSIAVDGICLTAVKMIPKNRGSQVHFDISHETWSRTTLKNIKINGKVNLERALQMRGRFGGHFVQGHVDGVGTLIKIEKQEPCQVMTFSYPPQMKSYIVQKGSIAISGISLTISSVKSPTFTVALIPATLDKTTLRQKKVGDSVNLESDILVRAVVHQLELQGKKV